jgi:CRISPR system Cascade subunit CasD
MRRDYTLLLRLEGPMQSWGYRSRFDYRDTALEPTRSGVIGLICAAMGIAREDKKEILRFDPIRMGVRVDEPTYWRTCFLRAVYQGPRPERDYHTALDVIKADGKGTDTVVSYRDYLADASFTVGLQSDDLQLLQSIADALQCPKWPLFLGRKAFPLAVPPLKPGEAPKEGCLEDHLLSNDKKIRVVFESPDGERTQHDWPLCFNERRFKPRTMTTRFTGGIKS